MPEISNEVLSEKLEGVVRLIEEKFKTNKSSHDAILEQVTRTNGTVKVNSSRLDVLENWKSTVVGALIAMNIVIIPVFFIIISNWLNGK